MQWHELTQHWYRPKLSWLCVLLLPFAWIFAGVTSLRRWLYRVGLKRVIHFPVPVVVVGNLTVGGTGKTPFTIWLADCLKTAGFRPGIVSRGVGGKRHKIPHLVLLSDDAAAVGDEAMLLAEQTQCPVVVGIDRAACVRQLLAMTNCDVVISDDGLQHYRMGRHLDIVLIDGIRRFGNQQRLPAGPLREARSRLNEVDFVVVNGGDEQDVHVMQLYPTQLVSLENSTAGLPLSAFAGKTVHAVAGIGHPEQFFSLLKSANIAVIPHRFNDHHAYQAKDIQFDDDLPILMTLKDAVKCRQIEHQSCWYLAITATLSAGFKEKLLAKLKTINPN